MRHWPVTLSSENSGRNAFRALRAVCFPQLSYPGDASVCLLLFHFGYSHRSCAGKELAVVTDASSEGDRNSEEEEIDVPEDVEIALGNLFELLTDKVR